jgi:hypothetical protein
MGDLADSFERMIAAIKFFRAHSRGDDEDLSGEEDASLMGEANGEEQESEQDGSKESPHDLGPESDR